MDLLHASQARLWRQGRLAEALLLIVTALVTVSCQNGAKAADTRQTLRLVFRPQWVEELSKALPEFDLSRIDQPSDGLTAEALQRGSADCGLALSNRISPRSGEQAVLPFDMIRGIAVLNPFTLQLLALPGIGINSLKDLAGRRVDYGAASAGTALIADVVLQGFGVDPSSLQIEHLSLDEALHRFRNRSLDAKLVAGGYPNDAVKTALNEGLSLLPIDGPNVNNLRASHPFIRPVNIPSSAYGANTRGTHTVGIDMVAVCRSDLSNDVVYKLTAALFQALPSFSRASSQLRYLDPTQAAATPIPLHGGAARYYREQELLR
jgi:TRAP transporter TAXI family solute receptor